MFRLPSSLRSVASWQGRISNNARIRLSSGYAGAAAASSEPLISVRSIPAPHCGSIRVLALNNHKTRNAISRALLAELNEHVQEITAEQTPTTRALILTSGIDEAFCAGADLKERKGFTAEETARFLTNLRGTLRDIYELPIPTISAISSLAFGGGLELALSTHLRVFGSTAHVGLPETRLGIIPGAGGTYRLPAVIGRTRALDLMLTGRRVPGSEAYFLGLCDRLVEIDLEEAKEPGKARAMVLDAAIDLASTICEGGPIALGQVIRRAGLGEEEENRGYEVIMGTKDRDEALKAFAEKRKPRFTGR